MSKRFQTSTFDDQTPHIQVVGQHLCEFVFHSARNVTGIPYEKDLGAEENLALSPARIIRRGNVISSMAFTFEACVEGCEPSLSAKGNTVADSTSTIKRIMMTATADRVAKLKTPIVLWLCFAVRILALDHVEISISHGLLCEYGRLSETVVPIEYTITMLPDFDTELFSGHVQIFIDVRKKARHIRLHAKNLALKFVKVRRDGPTDRSTNSIELAKALVLPRCEMIFLVPKISLDPAFYRIEMRFNGSMADKMSGFYVSTYSDPRQPLNVRKLATTQFEPNAAREAFPCFDEPSFKAIFNVRMIRPMGNGYHSLSNMPIRVIEENSPKIGLATVFFEPSLPMSTYLVAFVVSDFVAVTGAISSSLYNRLPVRVFTTSTKVRSARFSLAVAERVCEFYSELFDVRYPLPKIDMIGIPDFANGAMENWGLVTYKETTLLYDSEKNSPFDMRNVANTVAHELAHMWFGNLVTMRWWEDVWLNEGFATYMKYVSIDYLFRDWCEMQNFVTETKFPAMDLDSLVSSHPIIQTARTTTEINGLFDTISYKKGASIIRMLHAVMGDEEFIRGIRNYVKIHRFKVTVTRDLLEALQRENRIPEVNIVEIANTWMRQSGFPVVNVLRNKNTIFLTQHRFSANIHVTHENSSPYGYTWHIPVTFVTSSSNRTETVWFNGANYLLAMNIGDGVDWVKFNSESIGYYKVNYDRDSWAELSDLLKKNPSLLPAVDRADLLDSVFSNADAGKLAYDVALNLANYLSTELDLIPWEVAAKKLSNVIALLYDTTAYPMLQKYLKRLVKNSYNRLGWEISPRDSFQQKQLRMTILKLACDSGHEKCLHEAGKLFLRWIHDRNSTFLKPEIRRLVYYFGMSTVGNYRYWNITWERYLKEDDSQEKEKLLAGLTAIREPGILKRLIELASNERFVRRHDYFCLITMIAKNPVGTPVVWDGLRANSHAIIERFTVNDRGFFNTIAAVTSSFKTEFRSKQILEFFDNLEAGQAVRTNVMEIVNNNIAWMRTNYRTIAHWLEELDSE